MRRFIRLMPYVVALGLGCRSFAQDGSRASVAESYLFAAANVDRAAHGLLPLQSDRSVSLAAVEHAREMARHRAISHQFSGESDLAERAGYQGAHFSIVTENVAEASDPSRIHDLWMQSAGHRANLLDPKVDAVGIAVIQIGLQFYAVEDFVRTVPSLTFEQQEAAVSQLIRESGVAVTPTTPDARSTCELASGYRGPRPPGFTMRFTGANLSALPAELTTRLSSGQYREAVVAACRPATAPFAGYAIAVLLYR